MGGDWRPAGRGQEAARTRRAGTKWKSREAACGTPGRAQKGAPPTPAIDGRPTITPPRPPRRPQSRLSMTPDPPLGRSKRTNALSARPQAGRRARAAVPSRRPGKKGAPSAQRGQNRRAIPDGACRRQRAPISCRAPQLGASRGRPATAEGVRPDRRAGRQGKAFPSLAEFAQRAYLSRAGRCQ